MRFYNNKNIHHLNVNNVYFCKKIQESILVNIKHFIEIKY